MEALVPALRGKRIFGIVPDARFWPEAESLPRMSKLHEADASWWHPQRRGADRPASYAAARRRPKGAAVAMPLDVSKEQRRHLNACQT